jgi:hypothetical protein
MTRKNYAKNKLHHAVQILAGAGDLETRITAAAGILIHIQESDISGSLAADLISLKAMLFDVADSSRGVFKARQLSGDTSKFAAVKFVDLYAALVQAASLSIGVRH